MLSWYGLVMRQLRTDDNTSSRLNLLFLTLAGWSTFCPGLSLLLWLPWVYSFSLQASWAGSALSSRQQGSSVAEAVHS